VDVDRQFPFKHSERTWLNDNLAMKYIEQCGSGRYGLRNSLSAILLGQKVCNSKTTITLWLKKKMFSSYKIKPIFMVIGTSYE